VIKHTHAWNWDRKGGRNLCYKHNQQNHVHEHQYKEMKKRIEDMWEGQETAWRETIIIQLKMITPSSQRGHQTPVWGLSTSLRGMTSHG
jgi:hypothetical protein